MRCAAMRADQLLVERGLAASRSHAVRLIAGGLRWRQGAEWRHVGKSGDDLPTTAELELLDASEARYVSRGGLKLAGALDECGIDPRGLDCLDVGQSTGGFTDCLLQRGAHHVTGVDVGQGQLNPKVRGDARVSVVEGVNARALCASDLPDATRRVDLVVADLSFISLTLVLPALVPFIAPAGALLALVKPQFELQPGQVGKGGIVRDPSLYAVVESRLRRACADAGLHVRAWLPSPIAGGDGNREFFIHAVPMKDGEPGAGRGPSDQF